MLVSVASAHGTTHGVPACLWHGTGARHGVLALITTRLSLISWVDLWTLLPFPQSIALDKSRH